MLIYIKIEAFRLVGHFPALKATQILGTNAAFSISKMK